MPHLCMCVHMYIYIYIYVYRRQLGFGSARRELLAEVVLAGHGQVAGMAIVLISYKNVALYNILYDISRLYDFIS